MKNLSATLFYGIFLCAVMAIPAWFLGNSFPIIGGPVFGMLIGMLAAYIKRPTFFEAGIKYTSKKILQYAIIFLGFGMDLFLVLRVGLQSLPVMIFSLMAAFLTAWLVGRLLKLKGNVPILIGVGTAICGGSAIAATAPVVQASDEDMAFSISTIFLFNVAAVFIFPPLGHFFGMSDNQFGMWAGTAINDTSSVLAAGYAYSSEAAKFATIVKLTRTLMIVPITLVLAFYMAWKAKRDKTRELGQYSVAKIFPWFILGFIAASIIVSLNILPESVSSMLTHIGKYMIVMAMTAIGLNTRIDKLIKNGLRPILLGLSCWIAVAVTAIIVQNIIAA